MQSASAESARFCNFHLVLRFFSHILWNYSEWIPIRNYSIIPWISIVFSKENEIIRLESISTCFVDAQVFIHALELSISFSSYTKNISIFSL